MALADHYLTIVLPVMLGTVDLFKIVFYKPTKILCLQTNNPVCDVLLNAACYSKWFEREVFRNHWELRSDVPEGVT